MRIFALGDLHLSRTSGKPMDIFGEQWRGHDERIRANWNALAEDEDLLLCCGDTSWAMHLADARADLEFLGTFRGTKLLIKGNHDLWWSSLARVRAVAPAGVEFLQNSAVVHGDVAVAGTRGWLFPGAAMADDATQNVFQREVERLRLSLNTLRLLRFRSLIVMMHYPPLRVLEESTPFSDLIEASGASLCVYGHLHGADIATAPQGERNGVRYRLVSADAVEFRPWLCEPATIVQPRRPGLPHPSTGSGRRLASGEMSGSLRSPRTTKRP